MGGANLHRWLCHRGRCAAARIMVCFVYTANLFFPRSFKFFWTQICFNCSMCAPVLNGQKISPLCEGSCITFYIGGFWFMKLSRVFRSCSRNCWRCLLESFHCIWFSLVPNAKRLEAFQEFFDSDARQSGLRIAVLCLRLTFLATNLVAKCSGAIPCFYDS